MHMADKTNMEQADIAAMAAPEGPVRVWWHGNAALPPESIILEDESAGIFGGVNMIEGKIPAILVLS